MAACCLGWGIQPSEYRSLTRLEREAFNDQARRLNEK